MIPPAQAVPHEKMTRAVPSKALVLGGGGMLGHKLYQTLRPVITTFATVRRSSEYYRRLDLFDAGTLVGGVDVRMDDAVERVLDAVRPQVVLNAVGIIKQLKEAHDAVPSIEINALLPHRLARLCAPRDIRLIHISTDCVFSGARGGYAETDRPDPVDLYGHTKVLGEVATPSSLTIRTSMIGREIETQAGLVEWFLSNRGGKVRGFRRAIYSGFTTNELSHLLADIALRHRSLSGVVQVSSDPISKFDLLTLINERYRASITIEPDDEFHCDRSLDSTAFRKRTGYQPPSWPSMIDEMAADPTPYPNWKQL